jgi:hypothetical protein
VGGFGYCCHFQGRSCLADAGRYVWTSISECWQRACANWFLQSWLLFSLSQTLLPFRDATSSARLAESWKVGFTLVLLLGILEELWFLGCSAGASDPNPLFSLAHCLYQISIYSILATQSWRVTSYIVEQASFHNTERLNIAIRVRLSRSVKAHPDERTMRKAKGSVKRRSQASSQ